MSLFSTNQTAVVATNFSLQNHQVQHPELPVAKQDAGLFRNQVPPCSRVKGELAIAG
jgi:hypothetical protein